MVKLLAPYVNGVMELTNEEIAQIAEKLLLIRDNFVESDEQPVCDTFYLTSTYNKENVDAPINGDTCESVLNSVEVVDAPLEGV